MAAREFDIVVVGELNPDLLLSGQVTPAFGQAEQLIAAAELTIGSSAAIFACGAARLGLRVAFIGKIGPDHFGRFMRDALAERGIDISGIIEDPAQRTGLSVILNRGEDRAILTYSGAISALRFAEIPDELLTRAGHLHLASYYLQEALRPEVPALFEKAHRLGLSTSLDPNYDPAERWTGLDEVLPRTDIFLPNAAECCAIARQPDVTAAARLLAASAGSVVVKLGAQGALLQQGTQSWTALSLPMEVRDTVGAGDTFDAGYLYGYLAGWEPLQTLRFAAVCGALSTRQAGGTAAQPTLAEALPYLEK
jgi:sugar/nucleoside kinase (ribokinase family)